VGDTAWHFNADNVARWLRSQ